MPKGLSTKDLSYLSDMFDWNNIIINKLNLYINSEIDEEVKDIFQNLLDMHISNRNSIISILKEECK